MDNGDWASVRVTPASGTTACLGMIVAMYLDLGFRRCRPRLVARPLVAAINTVASAHRRPLEPSARARARVTLFANFHVVAEVPR